MQSSSNLKHQQELHNFGQGSKLFKWRKSSNKVLNLDEMDIAMKMDT